MNKKMRVTLAALGLVTVMAVPAFANESIGNYKFAWKTNRQTNIETMAKKAGLPVDELLAQKEEGFNCEDFMKEHGFTADELKEARLEEQFKLVDEKVAVGLITEEEGKLVKEKIQDYRFLLDGNGPHQGKREGMKMNINLNKMQNKGGRGPRFQRQ